MASIWLKELQPGWDVSIYEAGSRPLRKVAVTGGGRCNITNTFEHIRQPEEAYPRGGRLMGRLLKRFGPEETLAWFRSKGVRFTVQDDGCVFPASQDAMQIVKTLEREMRLSGVSIHNGFKVREIHKEAQGFSIISMNGDRAGADLVLVTAGGHPSASGLSFLTPLGVETIPPVPSLYTLRIGDTVLKSLAGTVVQNASASIGGTSFKASGALLITDWGLSGPAILKLSSYAARHLAENGFRSDLRINWLFDASQDEARDMLQAIIRSNPGKMLQNTHPEAIPQRLWKYLATRSGARQDIRCSEIGSKGINRFAETLVSDIYQAEGRAAFKEEFVTCGGVSLKEINPGTMEHKKIPGLFFAGEILDIDAITGGFNLQAAWTAGVIAAESMASISDMHR
jgi:predicted Rossmann fold flavoprotein